MKRLTEAEQDDLLRRSPEWRLAEDRTAITREFRFKDFGAAWSFMTRVAAEAERLDHHPDWSNSFNRVSITLSTHDAGGLTERDATLAGAIDAAVADPG